MLESKLAENSGTTEVRMKSTTDVFRTLYILASDQEAQSKLREETLQAYEAETDSRDTVSANDLGSMTGCWVCRIADLHLGLLCGSSPVKPTRRTSVTPPNHRSTFHRLYFYFSHQNTSS